MTRSPDPEDPKLDPRPSLRARLEKKYGEGVDPGISLGAEGPAASGATSELLDRLSEHGSPSSRYQIEGEVARGGMGAILRVWDEDLRRHLAMKVILGARDVPASDAAPRGDSRVLARFLEEAQVTGQLDHPGIVPVHELGLDSEGRVYFTMKLVKGRDLKAIFDFVFQEQEGWSETRALGVLQRVCEAMAYAHKKGVIHRDLKPANVMVGDFGEVFVMDWGLARVRGHKDRHDAQLLARTGIEPSELRAEPGHEVRTERSQDREGTPHSPLLTDQGDVMGTPAYMPPEQARGEIDQLSPRSDVYSVGAMLYHLLARQVPYAPSDGQWSPLMVLERVRSGPPRTLSEFGRSLPAELVAICEKAMARRAEDRYADMLALAEDLRAYLEHRVVGAYETGAWAEARKWVQRNKALAAASAAAILLTIGGLALNSYHRTRTAKEIAAKEQFASIVQSLSAIQDLNDLEARAESLWPAHPANVRAFEDWLEDARTLVEGSPEDPARNRKRRPSFAEHKQKLAEVEKRASLTSPDGELRFEDGDDRWWHAQLAGLVADLEAFTDAGSGLDSEGISPAHGWGVRRRLLEAQTIDARSRTSPEAQRRWEEAVAAIASNPGYGGLRIAPQLGLLPLGEDPVSHLWEFGDLETGEPPIRRAGGHLEVSEETGLVFVLLPGGSFEMGAQQGEPRLSNLDPRAVDSESPVTTVALAPFFLSKFEMTQGQWVRFHGTNPSAYPAGKRVEGEAGDVRIDLRHPVETVDWEASSVCMQRLGLALPTEAQWEYAVRAGTTTPWFTGDSPESLRDSANFADARLKRVADDPTIDAYATWDDGWAAHGPVGTYAPNAFGLHDMAGNVMEWCLDRSCPYSIPPMPGDGRRECTDTRRAIRGGAFDGTATYLRSANRLANSPEFASHNIGLRPARKIEE